MIVCFNGEFLTEEQARVPISDRGFLYGDGLFETMRVCGGRPFRWGPHWERLARGAALLRLNLPCTPEEFHQQVEELIRRNRMPESVLRLQVTRGVGPRGYSIGSALSPCVVITLHPLPAPDTQRLAQWRLQTSSLRVPADDPLATVKSCNRLPGILARAEAEAAGADEGLLCNPRGILVEAAAANIFWLANGELRTPPIAEGALPGITRALILELAPALGLACRECSAPPETLFQAQGVFLTLSTLGVVEAVALNGRPLERSPVVARLHEACHRQMLQECA